MEEKPWHKSYDPKIPKFLEYPDIPIFKLLERAAENYPERAALIFLGEKIKYRGFLSLVNRFASALSALGVKKGDRISLYLPNTPHFPIAYYGSLKAGAVVVNTNPLYTERELEHQIKDSGSGTVITLDLKLTLPKIKTIKDKTSIRNVVVGSISDFLPFGKRAFYSLAKRSELEQIPSDTGYRRFTDLISNAAMPELLEMQIEGGDIAALQYTGGTTGIPRGAVLTHRNLVSNAHQVRAWGSKILKDGEETFLTLLPLFHVYAMTNCMNLGVLLGATLVLLPRFQLKEVLEAIKRHRPTVFPGVPAIYSAIINHPRARDYGVESIKLCLSGGSTLPIEVQYDFERITGGKIIEGYGLSESGEKELPPGETGELIIKGPQVMKGYWGYLDDTSRVLRDGWLYTGDIARMDEEGYFHIVDRKKELIITDAYNVYPREVEEVLYAHPKVLEAVVVGVPSKTRGEIVKAFIVLKNGEEATRGEITEFCRERLASYKVPRLV